MCVVLAWSERFPMNVDTGDIDIMTADSAPSSGSGIDWDDGDDDRRKCTYCGGDGWLD